MRADTYEPLIWLEQTQTETKREHPKHTHTRKERIREQEYYGWFLFFCGTR